MATIPEIAATLLADIKSKENGENGNPEVLILLKELAHWDGTQPYCFGTVPTLQSIVYSFAVLYPYMQEIDRCTPDVMRAVSKMQAHDQCLSVVDAPPQELPGPVYSGGVIWMDHFPLMNPRPKFVGDDKVQMLVYDGIRYLPFHVLLQLLGAQEDYERFDMDGWEVDMSFDRVRDMQLNVISNPEIK